MIMLISAKMYLKYILAEIVIDNTKVILVNVYVPNDTNQQVVFLRGLSKNLLSKYDNENLVLGGDFNCVISALDKRGGKPVGIRKASTIELNALITTQNLLDTWRYKNPHSFDSIEWNFIQKCLESLSKSSAMDQCVLQRHLQLRR